MSVSKRNLLDVEVAMNNHHGAGLVSRVLFDLLLYAGYGLGEIAKVARDMNELVEDERPDNIRAASSYERA